jgi:hypothetical protein
VNRFGGTGFKLRGSGHFPTIGRVAESVFVSGISVNSGEIIDPGQGQSMAAVVLGKVTADVL